VLVSFGLVSFGGVARAGLTFARFAFVTAVAWVAFGIWLSCGSSRFREGVVLDCACGTQRFAFRAHLAPLVATQGGLLWRRGRPSFWAARRVLISSAARCLLLRFRHTVAGEIAHSMVRGFAGRVKPATRAKPGARTGFGTYSFR
jgi:hypothetical protein